MNNFITLFLGCISLLIISCKTPTSNNSNLSENESSIILDDSLYFECIEIVKDSGEFKWSCAQTYNTCKLSKNYFYFEIIEPLTYEVDKISKTTGGYFVSMLNGPFSYSIDIVDSSRGISYWKCINIPENTTNPHYSFYAIEKNKSVNQHLEKQIYEPPKNELADWVGEYTCEISAIDGKTDKEINLIFKLILIDLNHIEFSNDRFKVRVMGDFTDINKIQGDVAEVIVGKDGFPEFEPFIIIEKEGDVMFVTCPLITHGPGFSSTPYAFEKVKVKKESLKMNQDTLQN